MVRGVAIPTARAKVNHAAECIEDRAVEVFQEDGWLRCIEDSLDVPVAIILQAGDANVVKGAVDELGSIVGPAWVASANGKRRINDLLLIDTVIGDDMEELARPGGGGHRQNFLIRMRGKPRDYLTTIRVGEDHVRTHRA